MNVGGIGVTTDDYLDLSQVASIVNRRFYRQGLNWAVAGFEFFTNGPFTGEIGISKVPDTWVASNSWEKGFRAWQKMNNDALDEAESVRPRFLDYKVYMDAGHHAAGSAANLLPVTVAGLATAGQWDYSKYVVPFGPASPGNTTDFDVIWTGANFPGPSPATGADAVSLIEGYAASRGLPQILDPNAPADAADADGSTPENWLSALQNEGIDQDSEVLEDLISENNQAPYPYEGDGAALDTQYPGGANQMPGLQVFDLVRMSNTTVGAKAVIGGTNFQGGLVKISNTPRQYTLPSGDQTNAFGSVTMIVRLVPGHHRGYMCQPMTDV